MGAKGKLTRFLAGLLCLCMVFSLTDGVFGGMRALAAEGLPEASPTGPETNEVPAAETGIMDDHSPYHTIGATKDVTRVADPDTMDSYMQALLGGGADGTSTDFGTRNAGRLWADKSVFANGEKNGEDFDGSVLKLTLEEDGTEGSVPLKNSLSGTEEDFLHVFSVLSSSQQYIGVSPSAVTIVIDNSGSMYTDNATTWSDTRMSKTVDAVNRAIDSLMRAGPYNQVSVVLFGNGKNSAGYDKENAGDDTAVEIILMGHYEVSQPAADGTTTPLDYLQARWSGTPSETTDTEQEDVKGDPANHTLNMLLDSLDEASMIPLRLGNVTLEPVLELFKYFCVK